MLFSSLIDQFENNYKEYEPYFPDRTYNQIKSQYHNYRHRDDRRVGLQRGIKKQQAEVIHSDIRIESNSSFQFLQIPKISTLNYSKASNLSNSMQLGTDRKMTMEERERLENEKYANVFQDFEDL